MVRLLSRFCPHYYKQEASVYQNNPYHCVLIIELNDNNRRVISQFTGLPKQLHILKNQQLVPRGAEGLSQHLQEDKTFKVIEDRFSST